MKKQPKTNSRLSPKIKKGDGLKRPLLSVVVPAYNCADFIEKGVKSLLEHDLVNLLEVLVVNDGSKDNTLEIARGLEKKYPMVRVIDKRNGGHGSTINVGIQEAKGEYFRLMDGDDYFNTEAFVDFLKRLRNEKADVVLTDYSEDFIEKRRVVPVRRYENLPKNQVMPLENMTDKQKGFQDWGPLLSTTTCKTDLLKSVDFKIDEKCFYVDMEYNFLVYVVAETLIYYPMDVYRYVQERVRQSVNIKNMAKNYLQHEKVCLRLLSEYAARKNDFGDGKREYLRDRLVSEMCNGQYFILLHYLKDRKKFLEFDEKLKKYPDFYNSPKIAGKIVTQLRRSNGCFLVPIVKLSEFFNFLRR